MHTPSTTSLLVLRGSVPEKANRGLSGHSAIATRTSASSVSPFPQLSSHATARQGALERPHSFVANATGYTKRHVSLADIPLTNSTGTILGPLDMQYYVPITVPNMSAVGAGGGPVFVASGVNPSFAAASVPSPVNPTAPGKTVP
ncbi:hypothetical protein EDB87DRAFT_1737742 [Lactarius vividus]|nr:hypothetical protein EDB87DRAFT_1737742 [Lactarius vividus]